MGLMGAGGIMGQQSEWSRGEDSESRQVLEGVLLAKGMRDGERYS